MNLQQHKEAIEAAIRAAQEDGFTFSVDDSCEGMSYGTEVTLYKEDQGFKVESVEIYI
ncbi:hypothetical protein ACFC1L_39940 [Streptomyces sp. NPDC056210]|uniref:hypothetical protein n=1 Tax=Streptomyces sp. NPDC056210 TaxID=3345746 RepID=UPI0035DC0ECB